MSKLIYNLKSIILSLIFITIPSFLFPIPSHAAGIEIRYLGLPLPSPLFTVANFLPGDSDSKTITIKNTNSTPRMVSFKAVRTGPDTETNPLLESILDFKIVNNGQDIYGGTNESKTVSNLFTESSVNNIVLGSFLPDETKSFTFDVYFPKSAGNEYQRKAVIFDLIFKDFGTDSIVINEVYYKLKPDNGNSGCCGNVNATISGNGANSTNIINISIANTCVVIQNNFANVLNSIISNATTGGNSGISTTGNASSLVNILNLLNFNFGSGCSGSTKDQPWVELYNPTDQDVNLKNWSLTDDSGSKNTITTNTVIKKNGFALISKDSSVWNLWNENVFATKIYLGSNFGNGLDVNGDHLILKDPANVEVDFTAWNGDTFRSPIWNQIVNPKSVQIGSSIERKTKGFDLNLPSDWLERIPPTPGN